MIVEYFEIFGIFSENVEFSAMPEIWYIWYVGKSVGEMVKCLKACSGLWIFTIHGGGPKELISTCEHCCVLPGCIKMKKMSIRRNDNIFAKPKFTPWQKATAA